MHLYLATTNPGKLRDFAHALTEGYTLEPLPGIADMPVPDETEDSFEGNAVLKAVYYSRRAPELYVLADDSGLEVDALGGAPGVRSARFADDVGLEMEAAGDARNNAALLRALGGAESAGRYRCVLALARTGEVVATAHGTVEGRVLTAPRGDRGFGYDPLFWLPEAGLTMAEVDVETRQAVSHRGRALMRLLETLGSKLQQGSDFAQR